MRILLTNDDGIEAEGLKVLESIAAALSDDVWVCAPEVEQSGASRALTLSMPVRVRKLGPRRFAVSGTPTDCVMLAVTDLIDGPRPDLVLSGVNHGQNIGEDVTMSGTVAGAIQGMVLGIPSIALSQTLERFHDDYQAVFDSAEAFAPGLIARLVETGWPKDVLLNLNFPDTPADQVTEVEVTTQGRRDATNMNAERRTDRRGRDYYWMGFSDHPSQPAPGCDITAIAEGRISVTPLHIDLTHRPTVNDLKGRVGGVPPRLPARTAAPA
ncbi:MAG TPA: 5'/3'-nucleotidase SurE [Caulobacteraceae bacterium]|jgi:5'-nucleotidase|nr:5'/3'-nucleotidase SurE [Caulobacteraceae bacterium]